MARPTSTLALVFCAVALDFIKGSSVGTTDYLSITQNLPEANGTNKPPSTIQSLNPCDLPTTCPAEQSGAMAPNPGNCTTYLECVEGHTPIVRDCPQATCFDQHAMRCIHCNANSTCNVTCPTAKTTDGYSSTEPISTRTHAQTDLKTTFQSTTRGERNSTTPVAPTDSHMLLIIVCLIIGVSLLTLLVLIILCRSKKRIEPVNEEGVHTEQPATNNTCEEHPPQIATPTPDIAVITEPNSLTYSSLATTVGRPGSILPPIKTSENEPTKKKKKKKKKKTHKEPNGKMVTVEEQPIDEGQQNEISLEEFSVATDSEHKKDHEEEEETTIEVGTQKVFTQEKPTMPPVSDA